MQEYVLTLFLLPFIMGATAFLLPSFASATALVSSVLLIAASTLSYIYYDARVPIEASLLNTPFLIADFLLLSYFVYIGFKSQNKKIIFLSILQAAVLFAMEGFDAKGGDDIVVDRLSVFMFLLINIVGSVIVVYAIRYIKDETSDVKAQAKFLAILIAFLGVMNLLVSADNIKWLFLFFELTTLASFWLIGFRDNKESKENAITALWMNQIGGAALLFAAFIAKAQLHTLYISEILVHGGTYLAAICAFISIAAMIKGAQMPFSNWLLGAMVAPTPVSAILHSSTMVKIAPYLILKISPAVTGTLVGGLISLVGAISFLASAALALREDSFKKILAYSTISLLGLMILTASLGTPLTVLACLLLIIFHGVSKAMLFMCAGILEKRHHVKSIESVEGLIGQAPILTSLITLGFLSIALPPFGVFFAKWLAYEGTTSAAGVFTAILILFIAVGSVALTLLYFKTVGRFVASGKETESDEDISYLGAPLTLGLFLLVFAVFVSEALGGFFKTNAEFVTGRIVMLEGGFFGIVMPFGVLEFWHILAALILLGVIPILASRVKIKGVDIAKPYSCGEKIETNAYSFYFEPAKKIEGALLVISGVLFAAIITVGMLNI